MATAEKTLPSDVDVFFVGNALGRAPLEMVRTGIRSPLLQAIVNETLSKMLASSAPLMPQRVAGKVFGKLLKPGRTSLNAHPMSPALQGCFDFCIKHLRGHDGYRDLAEGLRQVCNRLAWVTAPPGPFASMNFEKSNSYAVLIGPGGLEEQADARMGISMLHPYARMPDHRLQTPRAYLALTDFQFSNESTGWIRAKKGTVCFAPADEVVAYRCTTEPLLMIWCDISYSSAITKRI